MGPELPFLCIPPPESQVSLRPPLLDQTAAVLRPALGSQAGYYLLLPRPNCRCFVIYFIGLNMTLVSHHQGHVVIPLLPLGTELGLDPLPPQAVLLLPPAPGLKLRLHPVTSEPVLLLHLPPPTPKPLMPLQ